MPRSQIYIPSAEDAIAFICEATWGFAELDTEGNFIWVNKAYCEILNSPIELVIGTSQLHWTHPDDVEIDRELAERVKSGVQSGYALSKQYIQRGSTPQRQSVVWGLLSVSGKWTDGKFAGYRAEFRVYETPRRMPMNLKVIAHYAVHVTKWSIENWKVLVVMLVLVTSSTLGGSAKLLDTLRRAVDTKRSVDAALDSLSSGASSPPTSPSPAGQP